MTVDRLRLVLTQARAGRSAIISVVAASGQVVRCAVDAGADLLLALNAGPFRTGGRGSLAAFLPFGNANDQTEALLHDHVLSQAGDVPVVAGVLGSDPTRDVADQLMRLKALGVAGIVNWPAVGFVDGRYREALEEAGLGIASELVLLERAKELGFVTFGFALAAEGATQFCRGPSRRTDPQPGPHLAGGRHSRAP